MDKIADEAAYVFQIMNAQYFRVLLTALEAVAVANGYYFEKGGESVELTHELKQQFGDAVARARRMYLAPRTSDSDLEKRIGWDNEDGYSIGWLEALLSTLKQRGFSLKGRAVQKTPEELPLNVISLPAWQA